MNELELIARLAPDLATGRGVVQGVGDDCAVLEAGWRGKHLLFKVDAVVEGIHFTRQAAPEQIGHKALGRALSDIAAMAGTPTHALVTLALPREFDPSYIERIYRGLNALAARHGVGVVGGETTTNPERVLLSVALLGEVEAGKAILRRGARPGDALMVTGELGGSLAGKHLEFEPRLAEARWLAAHFEIHAMIDLSDGLASDLRHLLKAGGVGAELLAKALPISRAARWRARHLPGARAPLAAALEDGEDYELLFAVPGRLAVKLADAWKSQFPALRLSCIGKVTSTPGVLLRETAGARPVTEHGYVHFA